MHGKHASGMKYVCNYLQNLLTWQAISTFICQQVVNNFPQVFNSKLQKGKSVKVNWQFQWGVWRKAFVDGDLNVFCTCYSLFKLVDTRSVGTCFLRGLGYANHHGVTRSLRCRHCSSARTRAPELARRHGIVTEPDAMLEQKGVLRASFVAFNLSCVSFN